MLPCRTVARPRQAAEGVCPVCFRTVDSEKAPVVSLNTSMLHHKDSLTVSAADDNDGAGNSVASPEDMQSEPSCEVISRAQQEADEGERGWLLSQACGFYRRRCTTAQVNKDMCVRVMGESCSARVLQCSLLNTMQNLEPATQTTTQGRDKCLLKYKKVSLYYVSILRTFKILFLKTDV